MGGAEGGEGGEEGREEHSALADSSSKLPFIQSPLRLPFSQDQLGWAGGHLVTLLPGRGPGDSAG